MVQPTVCNMLKPYSESIQTTTYSENLYIEDGMSSVGRDFKW
jgi:hypothetical protein